MKISTCLSCLMFLAPSALLASDLQTGTFVRTERYPRPPYSGATYHIYERDGQVVCTKLQVCNKYDQCITDYRAGSYKDDLDAGDEPSGRTPPVKISPAKQRQHACLTKHGLVAR